MEETIDQYSNTTKLTIKEWYQHLPDPYQKQALNNLEERQTDKVVYSMHEALRLGFWWEDSPTSQGEEYWREIYKCYIHKTTLPIYLLQNKYKEQIRTMMLLSNHTLLEALPQLSANDRARAQIYVMDSFFEIFKEAVNPEILKQVYDQIKPCI